MLLKVRDNTFDIANQLAINNVIIIALDDVDFAIWWQLFWRQPSTKMAEINVGGVKNLHIWNPSSVKHTYAYHNCCSAWRIYYDTGILNLAAIFLNGRHHVMPSF